MRSRASRTIDELKPPQRPLSAVARGCGAHLLRVHSSLGQHDLVFLGVDLEAIVERVVIPVAKSSDQHSTLPKARALSVNAARSACTRGRHAGHGAQVSHVLPVSHDAVADRVRRLKHVASRRALVTNHDFLRAQALQISAHGCGMHAPCRNPRTDLQLHILDLLLGAQNGSPDY